LKGERLQYGFDPICLGACGLYAINSARLGLFGVQGFGASYLNDLLLIPCALPLVLWFHHGIGWREGRRGPTIAETGGHLLLWAVLGEGLGPIWFADSVRDPWDVLAYAAGAAVALFWWHRDRWVQPWRRLKRKVS